MQFTASRAPQLAGDEATLACLAILGKPDVSPDCPLRLPAQMMLLAWPELRLHRWTLRRILELLDHLRPHLESYAERQPQLANKGEAPSLSFVVNVVNRRYVTCTGSGFFFDALAGSVLESLPEPAAHWLFLDLTAMVRNAHDESETGPASVNEDPS